MLKAFLPMSRVSTMYRCSMAPDYYNRSMRRCITGPSRGYLTNIAQDHPTGGMDRGASLCRICPHTWVVQPSTLMILTSCEDPAGSMYHQYLTGLNSFVRPMVDPRLPPQWRRASEVNLHLRCVGRRNRGWSNSDRDCHTSAAKHAEVSVERRSGPWQRSLDAAEHRDHCS